MNWPGACEKGIWATVNSDLRGALERLKGTVERKVEKMGGLIYKYGEGRFGVCKSRIKSSLEVGMSMRQRKIDRLVREQKTGTGS